MSTVYFMPVMLVSIIPVIWGLNILIRLVGPVLPEHSIRGKYLMLQLVLLVCKIQPAIGDLIYQNVDALREIKVQYPMTVEFYKNGGCDEIDIFSICTNFSFNGFFFSYHSHNNSHPDGIALAGGPKLLQDSPEGSTPRRGRATAKWGDYDCCD